jgi:UDP-N-acetylmuramoyl-L-alanyl-D-glutamate--2,6-diaminopimelate ligase
MLGTIEYDLGSERIDAPLTTPESLDLHRYLRTMADAGCDSAFLETSSHSLCQHRVAGIHFDTAVFTNLTQDHLDYHRTMEDYRDAKALLFRDLLPDSVAVLNLDDTTGPRFAGLTRARVFGFSIRGDAHRSSAWTPEIAATIRRMSIHGTVFSMETPWGAREVRLKLAGAHNVQNAIGALAAAVALGADFDRSIEALESFAGVPGRLESVELPREAGKAQTFRVFVDYAHTEDALRSVMNALRALKPSRLITVFGCGGDRDRTKRPKMGRAVEELTDLGVITSDNPRTEDPHAILGEICGGIRVQNKFIVEPDRAKAIARAIAEARSDDVVLIAGKGHETYQIFGQEKRHFSDVEEALKALKSRFAS